jgi:hypothetical protein
MTQRKLPTEISLMVTNCAHCTLFPLLQTFSDANPDKDAADTLRELMALAACWLVSSAELTPGNIERGMQEGVMAFMQATFAYRDKHPETRQQGHIH